MRENNIPYDVTYLADAFSSFFALLAELWSPAAVAARTKNAATARDSPDAVDIAKPGQEANEPPAEEKEKAGSSSEFFFGAMGENTSCRSLESNRGNAYLSREEEGGGGGGGKGILSIWRRRGRGKGGGGGTHAEERKRAFLLSSLLRTSFPDSFAIGLPSLLLLFRRERTRRVRP